MRLAATRCIGMGPHFGPQAPLPHAGLGPSERVDRVRPSEMTSAFVSRSRLGKPCLMGLGGKGLPATTNALQPISTSSMP
jgi:hypothetical protein